MDDKKKLYDGLLGLGFTESELGTFDTFSANLDNPEKNKVFYDALIGSKRVNVEQLGTYDTFSAKTLKKKRRYRGWFIRAYQNCSTIFARCRKASGDSKG